LVERGDFESSNFTSVAPKLSSSWLILVAPKITLVTKGFVSSQASAICATLAPCARPISRSFSRHENPIPYRRE